MFAISFDLVVSNAAKVHPRSSRQAYLDIENTLKNFGFDRIQGSVYVTKTDDMANLFRAIAALKALPWLPDSVGDIRAFRVEQWSDFTSFIKE